MVNLMRPIELGHFLFGSTVRPHSEVNQFFLKKKKHDTQYRVFLSFNFKLISLVIILARYPHLIFLKKIIYYDFFLKKKAYKISK